MSQADALLMSIEEVVVPHRHVVSDPDKHFVIDPDSRQIMNVSQTPHIIMQNDHRSEIYTFELPRYVEGHDMLQCNRIRLYFNNIGTSKRQQYQDAAELTLSISPDDISTLVSAWEIRRQATQYAGSLNFLIHFMCVDSDGNVTYEWHTDIFSDVEIKATFNNGEAIAFEYANILEDWYQKLFTAGDSVSAEAIAQIAAKAEETLASIPEDYTTVANMAEEALRKKANAIILEAEGEAIVVDDSSDAYLLGLNLYGKTTQVSATGAQLFDESSLKAGYYANSEGGWVSAESPTYRTIELDIPTAGTYSITFGAKVTLIRENGETVSESGTSWVRELGAGLYRLSFRKEPAAEWSKGCTIMFNAGDTALPYEPYSGGFISPSPDWASPLVSIENLAVNIHGKNLCDISKAIGIGASSVITIEGNSVIISPNDTTYGAQLMVDNGNVVLKKGITYTCSCDYEGTHESGWGWRFKRIDGSWTLPCNSTVVTFTPDMDIEQVSFYLGFPHALTVEAKLDNVQIEIGETATEYESYKALQTIDMSRAIPGIPVDSGGNYTDANGQQWICDEIDFERGVYVQRVATHVFDGSDDEYWQFAERTTVNDGVIYVNKGLISPNNAYCSHYKFSYNAVSAKKDFRGYFDIHYGQFRVNAYGYDSAAEFREFLKQNPLTLMCPLAEPIETPLTDEEIANFKMVCTNYHNTTVLNDAGAHMVIKYNADTLIFLRDNQPPVSDERLQAFVDAWLTKHFQSAEGVSF